MSVGERLITSRFSALTDPTEGNMTRPLVIRKDRTPVALRKLAKAEKDTRIARRIVAIANALSGMSREAAAEAAGMDRQTLRDWVLRYNAHGIDGLCGLWAGGRPPRLRGRGAVRDHAHHHGGPRS
jgi:hypothetical protein